MYVRKIMLMMGLVMGVCVSLPSDAAEVLTPGELDAWDIIDMVGDAEVRTTRLLNPPPGSGRNVLDISGTQVLVLAKGKQLKTGTLLVLYREMQPRDKDADGVIVFRADYPEDISVEHNTKIMRPHTWFEQDNDTGLHFRSIGTDAKEKAYGERAGFGLITDEWNITNWIWQKVEVHENGVRAKYWPAHLSEPDEWHLDEPNFMSEGTRLGIRIGSGHIQLAHFAFGEDVVTPKRKKPWLYTAQDRFISPKFIPLWLFIVKGEQEETYSVYSHNRGRKHELEITSVETKDYGVRLILGHSALRVLKLSGRSKLEVDEAECIISITRNDPVQVRLTNIEKSLKVYKQYTRPDLKLHYDAAQAMIKLAKESIEKVDMERARRRLFDADEARRTLRKLSVEEDPEEENVIVTAPLSIHAVGDHQFETHLSLSLAGVSSMEILQGDSVVGTWKNDKKSQQIDVPQLHTFKLPPAIGHYTLRWRQGAEVHERLIVAQVVETKEGLLYVNGEAFLVKGVNVHALDSGNPQRTRQMMQSLKGLGFNVLRGDYPPLWEVEMAEEEDLLWTILAPFSVTSTEAIQYRQKGSLMGAAREIAIKHIVKYRDRPGVLLWNSCNEITGDTTAFLENLYPVYQQMDPISRRPVHYANLFGQDRWQGQDAVGINYYFAPGQTPEDKQPLIQRSIKLAKEHNKPVFYTEYNSYQGPKPETAVQAIEGFFEWGIEQGMSGGFFYMAPSSDRHPGVWLDAELNVDPRVAKAFHKAYDDATMTFSVENGKHYCTVTNRRDFSLRNVKLGIMDIYSSQLEEPAYDVGTLAPREKKRIKLSTKDGKSMKESKRFSPHLQFTTHYGLSETIRLFPWEQLNE